jgi:RNA-directed DNA polymerase
MGVCNRPARFYRHFDVPKSSGGVRRIDEPLPSLKEIQRWVLREILEKIPPSRYAKAFLRGKSIKENARFHRGQEVVATIDVKDFFPSIGFPKVYRICRQVGYTKPVAIALANLCLLHGCLPQGAPTSPALSNLVCRELDARLAGFCLKRKIRFTRYADDLTMSGDFCAENAIRFSRQVLAQEGFILNEKKTRVLSRNQRQQVTGVVVNAKLQVPRRIRAKLRQHVYYITKYGLASHMERQGLTKANFPMHLQGLAAHVLSINGSDRDAHTAIGLARRLQEEA